MQKKLILNLIFLYVLLAATAAAPLTKTKRQIYASAMHHEQQSNDLFAGSNNNDPATSLSPGYLPMSDDNAAIMQEQQFGNGNNYYFSASNTMPSNLLHSPVLMKTCNFRHLAAAATDQQANTATRNTADRGPHIFPQQNINNSTRIALFQPSSNEMTMTLYYPSATFKGQQLTSDYGGTANDNSKSPPTANTVPTQLFQVPFKPSAFLGYSREQHKGNHNEVAKNTNLNEDNEPFRPMKMDPAVVAGRYYHRYIIPTEEKTAESNRANQLQAYYQLPNKSYRPIKHSYPMPLIYMGGSNAHEMFRNMPE